jgi:hypothetical protein
MGTAADLICYFLKGFADFHLILGRSGTSSKGLASFLELLGGFKVT